MEDSDAFMEKSRAGAKKLLLFCFDNGREAVKRYEELSSIFSERDNYSQSRELLKEVSHGLIR